MSVSDRDEDMPDAEDEDNELRKIALDAGSSTTGSRLVFFDLETTGIGDTARIVQFGAVEFDPISYVKVSSVSMLIGGRSVAEVMEPRGIEISCLFF
jgi:hypothetical protein